MRSAFFTDYHRPAIINDNGVCIRKCDGCGHDFEESELRGSKITGELYCYHGELSCWKEAAQMHKQGCIDSGMAVTKFE